MTHPRPDPQNPRSTAMDRKMQSAVVGVVGICTVVYLVKRHYSDQPHATKAVETAEDGSNAANPSGPPSGPVGSAIGSPHPHINAKADYEGCIYLDNNATTPVYAEVFEAMRPFLTAAFGNPASGHIYGHHCAKAVADARQAVANLIHATDKEVLFMSCGTEADNRAVDIALHHFILTTAKRSADSASVTAAAIAAAPRGGEAAAQPITPALPVVIACVTEHPAVICYIRILAFRGKLTHIELPVTTEGVLDLDALSAALSPQVALVTVMHSNNETGTIQPIRRIVTIVQEFNRTHSCGILVHTDAAQSIGKTPIDVQHLGVDLCTLVGHKFGAPKGIGALYIRAGTLIPKLLIGGGQEFDRHAGTEAVPNIVALGRAAQLASEETGKLLLHYLGLKIVFLQELERYFPQWKAVHFNGTKRSTSLSCLTQDIKLLRLLIKSILPGQRMPDQLVDSLPNTISVSFKGAIGHELVTKLANKVACSAGSACHTAPTEEHPIFVVSEVLKAMQAPEEYALGTLRISFGRHSTTEEVVEAAKLIAHAVLN